MRHPSTRGYAPARCPDGQRTGRKRGRKPPNRILAGCLPGARERRPFRGGGRLARKRIQPAKRRSRDAQRGPRLAQRRRESAFRGRAASNGCDDGRRRRSRCTRPRRAGPLRRFAADGLALAASLFRRRCRLVSRPRSGGRRRLVRERGGAAAPNDRFAWRRADGGGRSRLRSRRRFGRRPNRRRPLDSPRLRRSRLSRLSRRARSGRRSGRSRGTRRPRRAVGFDRSSRRRGDRRPGRRRTDRPPLCLRRRQYGRVQSQQRANEAHVNVHVHARAHRPPHPRRRVAVNDGRPPLRRSRRPAVFADQPIGERGVGQPDRTKRRRFGRRIRLDSLSIPLPFHLHPPADWRCLPSIRRFPDARGRACDAPSICLTRLSTRYARARSSRWPPRSASRRNRGPSICTGTPRRNSTAAARDPVRCT